MGPERGPERGDAGGGRGETVAAGWLLELLGLPPSSSVGFVTGGMMANFSCLAAARHAVLSAAGWDVGERGLFGAPPIRLVVGADRHERSTARCASLV